MDRSQNETEVEWLDAGERPTPAESESESVGHSARWWIPLGVLAAAVLAFAVPAVLSGDDGSTTDGRAAVSEAARARARALGEVSLSFEAGDVGATVNIMQGRIVTELRSLASLDLAFRAVLTSPDGDDARLVSVSGSGDVRVAPLPQSEDFRFDASGEWLAGISRTTQGSPRQVLWAGRVGSKPEPVAVGIRSYAWHDSTGGLLAWTEDEEHELMTLALDSPDGSLSTLKPVVDGDVSGWGDWGFAVQTTGFDLTTAVLDPDGALVEPSLSGRFSGHLPTGELLLTGGLGDPVAFDPSSGRTRELPWLGDGRHVWSSAVADSPREAILVVGNDDLPVETRGGEITLLDGDAVNVLAETEAITDVAWSIKRHVVVFVDQQRPDAGSSGRIRTVDRDGMVDAVLIPDLFSGREWVAALSVR